MSLAVVARRFLAPLLVTVLGGLVGSLEAGDLREVRSLYLDHSPNPEPAHLLAHDLSIVDGRSNCDLIPVHRQGGRVLAVLSLSELTNMILCLILCSQP